MARPVFKLFGMIGMKGLENVKKDLKEVDSMAKKLEKSLVKTGRNITRMGKNLSGKLTAPILGIAGSLTVLSQKTGEYADKMLDLEQVTGLSVENLQKFELISREAGVSFDGLMGTISKFQSRLPQIIEGKGRAAEAMKMLGVNAKDTNGNIKDINKLFPELLGALNGIEDITLRNATAQQIFGRSMNDLAPVLSMSADDLERIGMEAENMGTILDKDALNAANNFRISVEKLQAQFTGVFRVLATKFIPVLNDTIVPLIKDTVVPIILGFGNAVGKVLGWFNSFSPEAKKITVVILGIVAAVGPALMIFGKFVIAMKALVPLLILAKKGMLLLNAAMAANPVGAVITLIMGLVAAVTLLYNENEEFREQFDETWDHIVRIVDWAVSELKLRFYELLASALSLLEGLEGIVPGLTTALDKSYTALGKLAAKEAVLQLERKKLYKATERAAQSNELLDKSIANAQQSVAAMTEEQKKQAEIILKDIKLKAEQIEAGETLAERRDALERQWTERLANSIRTRRGLLEAEYREAIAEAEKLGADRNAIELYYSIERMKMAQEEEREKQRLEDETAQKRQEQMEYAKNLTIQSVGDMIGVISDFYGLQIDQANAKKQADIDAVNASTMSEEQKAAAIEQIEAKSAKKIKELKRKQAIADKAQAIFGIAINTAQAIVTALAKLGPVAGAIAASVIGGIGAAQAAIVAAKPIPLAKGGLIKRTQGGVNTIIGEGKEDEIVIPLKTGVMQLADSLYSKVQEMSLNGIGAPAVAGMGRVVENTWNIGTLVADDRGIKELERRQRKFRVEEDQRRGREVYAS